MIAVDILCYFVPKNLISRETSMALNEHTAHCRHHARAFCLCVFFLFCFFVAASCMVYGSSRVCWNFFSRALLPHSLSWFINLISIYNRCANVFSAYVPHHSSMNIFFLFVVAHLFWHLTEIWRLWYGLWSYRVARPNQNLSFFFCLSISCTMLYLMLCCHRFAFALHCITKYTRTTRNCKFRPIEMKI